ncbi:PLP-dependent aminotransferase family protein [Bacillus gobiensis]|uniref:aminotransferase-like domain-containing protein n=1 Tax=Bacillus gobiensis TaxID=1441095 RepID=UPI003D21AFF5
MHQLTEFSFSKRFPELPLISAALAEEHPDFVPLSFGFPAKESFLIPLLSEAAVSALQTQGPESLQYTGGTGPKKVNEWIKKRSELRSIQSENENILVTSGSMQAIDLATRTLADPGDHVWIEAPSFFGAIRQFSLAEVELTSFPIDEDGLRVDLVEQALIEAKIKGKPMPKMFYVMPNYHNPTGVNLSLERRKKLAELAYEYNFYVLEDDAYVELSFSGGYVPSIYSFGPERVIYISTFSKIIAPGIRMGWTIAGEQVINKMRMLKSDGSTSVFVQEIVSQFLAKIDFAQHVQYLTSIYRARKDAMVRSIHEYFGNEVSYQMPEGGFFLWLTFPAEVNTSEFMEKSLKNGVGYLDGKHFYLQNDELNHIRLSFTFCDEEQIRRGIQRIAESYNDYKNNREVLEEAL